MKLKAGRIFVVAALILVAILLRYWLAPLTERLPADYANKAGFSEVDKFLASPTGGWTTST